MELILNTNELGYKPFLETKVDTIIIGLKDFCFNQLFSLSLNKIKTANKDLRKNNKKLYLSINCFFTEKKFTKLKGIFSKIIKLDVDKYIVSDLGVFNLFKNNNASNRVILDLQTYVTNKYSAKSLLSLGANRVVLSKEITFENIIEISEFNNSNIELLVQGYYPITYSKRHILNCYYKNNKLKKKNNIHFIKEEHRDEYYYLIENNEVLTVYYNTQYSLFNHLPELIKHKINYLRIDTNFLSEKEIKELVSFYNRGIEYILNNKENEFNKLKASFNTKYVFSSPFLYNESFLLKEGK